MKLLRRLKKLWPLRTVSEVPTGRHRRGARSPMAAVSVPAALTQDVVTNLDAHASDAAEQAPRDPADFALHLREQERLAAALAASPAKPSAGGPDGHVEIAAYLGSDTLMLIGWLSERRETDVSAVIVADQRYPAGLSGMSFERPDVPPPAAGFVAFVRTKWRPSPSAPMAVHWGERDPVRLDSAGLRVLSPVEAGHWLASLEDNAGVRFFRGFHRHLSQRDTWTPSEAALKEEGITYGIDAVTVVPGFGGFAAGWIASPYKRLRGMSLRLGASVAAGDRRSFSLVPRPPSFAAGGGVGDTSGTWSFRCVLHGSVREDDLAQPLLRLHFEDGTVYVVAVPPQALSVCAGPDALNRVGRLFPGLASDPSIDTFTDAFAKAAKAGADDIVPIAVRTCPQVAVFTVPSGEDDLLLAFAELRTAVALLPPDVGIALLASRHAPRARLLEGAEHLRAGSERVVSVFAIGEPAYALWSLGAVLTALEADRFWFCGPDVLPTRVGWQAAAGRFERGSDGLALFARAPLSGAAVEPDSLSFAWTSAAFLAWVESAPFFLEGFHRDNHLPSGPGAVRIEGAVGLLRSMIGSEPIRRVDERLYRQSGPVPGETAPAPREAATAAASWR